MFTPIENPANRLKIAEASTQVSTTAEVFLPHRYAAFFTPGNAVRNICSSISELCSGIFFNSPFSLRRSSLHPFQLSPVCQGSAHRVVLGHRWEALPPGCHHPRWTISCQPRLSIGGGPSRVTVLASLLLLHLGAQPSPFPLKACSQEGPEVTSHCYLLPANPRTRASFIWEAVF